jgi:CheY-like chemotaxis protein
MSRILVVEGEPDLRDILRTVLERAGHEVTDAGNRLQALASVHSYPPDLVVADMITRRTGGTELVRRLRADPSTAHIPILATSADRHRGFAVDTVLSSPYSRNHLVSAVEDLLGQDARENWRGGGEFIRATRLSRSL